MDEPVINADEDMQKEIQPKKKLQKYYNIHYTYYNNSRPYCLYYNNIINKRKRNRGNYY